MYPISGTELQVQVAETGHRDHAIPPSDVPIIVILLQASLPRGVLVPLGTV